jgi:hypothetical protein
MATPTNLPSSFSVGAILTAAQMNDVRGAFRILQVVTNTYSTAYSNSTNTYTDVGPSVDITPQATSSKILVVANINGAFKQTNNTALDLEIRRGTTTIYTATANFNTGSVLTNVGSVTMVYLDSPATTALRTYKVRGRSSANLASVGAQLLGASDSSITVFEVSA